MPVPVISVAQMRQWEQESWDAGLSQVAVITRAGQAIAQSALRITRSNDEILILSGKGHNGDDARSAQAHLSNRRIRLLEVRDPAADMARLDLLLARQPALVIDGLFGIGLSRPLDDPWSTVIEHINRSPCAVLSVDVPSGLNADTGEPRNVAICAQTTVSLGAPKRGMLSPGSYPFVGRLEVASDIGLTPCPFAETLLWTQEEDFTGYPPPRRVDGHKGTFGHVAIVAGSEGYHGAAVLAARAALRARPGLVSVFCHEAVHVPVASQLQAAMVHRFKPSQPLPASSTALVIGPGLAAADLDPAWKAFTNEQWQTSAFPVVVDASALDWLEKGPNPLNSRRLLTPHPGEAARLLGINARAVQENRVGALRELSSRYGNCWIVLKGHQTLIGRSTGELFINPSGNAFLAQGGSGDVLSGFFGGLLAQSKLQSQPLKTIRYGAWMHGATADFLSQKHGNWTIEELLQTMGGINPDELRSDLR